MGDGEKSKERHVNLGEVILFQLADNSLIDLARLNYDEMPRQQAVHHSHVPVPLRPILQPIL